MSAFVVGGFLVRGKDMVYQRRTIPADGKHEVRPGTERTGLGAYALLHIGIRLDIVQNKIGVVNHTIESPICILENFILRVVTEFVDLCTEVVVTIHVACCQHIVTRFVEEQGERHIDAFVTGDVQTERLVKIVERVLCIVIGLVETVERDDTLLLDVKAILTSTEE